MRPSVSYSAFCVWEFWILSFENLGLLLTLGFWNLGVWVLLGFLESGSLGVGVLLGVWESKSSCLESRSSEPHAIRSSGVGVWSFSGIFRSLESKWKFGWSLGVTSYLRVRDVWALELGLT